MSNSNNYDDWYGFGKAQPAQMLELDKNGTGDVNRPVDRGLWGADLEQYLPPSPLPASSNSWYAIRDIKGENADKYLKLMLYGNFSGDLSKAVALLNFKFDSSVQDNSKMVADNKISLVSFKKWTHLGRPELFRTVRKGVDQPIFTFKITLEGIDDPESENDVKGMKVGAYWCWPY